MKDDKLLAFAAYRRVGIKARDWEAHWRVDIVPATNKLRHKCRTIYRLITGLK